jgi:hypothetical protein
MAKLASVGLPFPSVTIFAAPRKFLHLQYRKGSRRAKYRIGENMCDYSLLSFPNRLAIEGERLTSYRFPSHSLGLASPADLKPAAGSLREAGFRGSRWSRLKDWLFSPEPSCVKKEVATVCIPPGSRLRVIGIPEKMQRRFDVGPVEDVTFFERSASAYEYRDTILFANGRCALFQDLHEGLRFEVVSLGMIEAELAPDVVRVR